MVDLFMLVMVIILAIIIIIVNIYLLAYYCTEDDINSCSGIFSKIIAILGMFIGLCQICLLPLDVSNTRGDGGNFQMDFIWKMSYILIIGFVFFIIPLTISVYESDPKWTCAQKLSNSFYYFIIKVVIVGCFLVIAYFLFNKVYITTTSLKCDINIDELWSNSDEEIISNNENKFLGLCKKKTRTDIKISLDISIYIMALLSLISYLLLMIFGGVGLFSFPIDLIYSFCTRPIKVKSYKLEEMKKEVVITAADLKDLGMELKKLEEKGDNKKNFFSKERRYYNYLLKKLKVGVSVTSDQFEVIKIQNVTNETSAAGYLAKLIVGIVCFILSILWIIQIIFYILLRKNGQPFHNFLNIPLVMLTNANFSFLAISIYILFTFYLLLITIKGNYKFGIRFRFLGEIHPMKKDNTYMNSILFNVMLVMLTSVSVVQTSIRAFGEYTNLTEADIIFNTQIKNLNYYSYFFKYNIFEYGMIIIAVISFFYFIFLPNDANVVRRILYKKSLKEKENNKGNLLGEIINLEEKLVE